MSIARSIARSWDRILAWYDANTPSGTLSVNPGATERQLAELESLIGTHLPEDFRESYKLVDGTPRKSWLLYHGPLLSLAQIAEEWQTYRKEWMEPGFGEGPAFQPRQLESPEIKPVWWTPLRLPITDHDGDPEMLDLDPASGGTRGQIIHMSHEVGPTCLLVRPRRRADQLYLWDMGDEADPIATLGTGMAGWLAQIAYELESGVHAYSKSSKMVYPVAWDR